MMIGMLLAIGALYCAFAIVAVLGATGVIG